MDGRQAPPSPRLIHIRPSAHPPRSGPFAALSKIVKDKRPHIQGIAGDRRLYNALPEVDLPAEMAVSPYLGFGHNDAEVIHCARGKTTFTLTFNHYDVWRLASIVDDGAWHRLRRSFPVTLRFEEVTEFWVVQQREIGDYRILRSSLNGLATMLWDIIALRCVGRNEDFRFDLMFNGRRSIRTKEEVENVVSILLTCESVSVNENLRQDWINAVGEETIHILDAFLNERPIQYGHIDEFERFVATHLS